MMPLKLTLRNFIGVRDGLGRDELTLDLDAICGDARLVAITGENGVGKTTLLDNLQTYRVLPYRFGGHTPGSGSFYDNVYGPEASKELIWEHDGATYRSSLLFKQTAKTKKTEAYVAVQHGEEWAPYTAPDGTKSDGKTDTYDRCIEAILGAPELFFTSAFSAQGKKLLASYGNGEIKPLMSELLGLNEVLELGKRANEVARGIKTQLSALSGELERAESAKRVLTVDRGDLRRWQETLAERQQARAQARDRVSKATTAVAEANAAKNASAEIEARRRACEEEIARAREAGNAREREIRTDMTGAREAVTRIEHQAKHDADWNAEQGKKVEAGIARHNALIGRAEEIEQAASEAERITGYIAQLETDAEAARGQAEQWRELKSAEAALEEKLKATIEAGKGAAEKVENLKRHSTLIGEVPCAGTDLQPRCKLLSEAVTARDTLPESEAELTRQRGAYDELKQEKARLAAQITELSSAAAKSRELDATLAEQRKLLVRAKEAAALTDQLTEARQAKSEAEMELDSLKRRAEEQAAAVQEQLSQAQARVSEFEARAKEAASASAETVARLERQLADMPEPTDDVEIEQAERALRAADEALAQAERAIEQANGEIAHSESRISSATDILAACSDAVSRAERMEADIAHWGNLARALSNDGVIALCIDDAGPTLASIANDLLAECFGGRCSVRIDTQRETAKGALREGFEIVVFDAESTDEKPLRMTSGGERIWINEAITRAIALYQAQNSGHAYECLFADESDGALDAEHKAQFMRMKRRVLELGGYRREFFISHTPELWGMADAQINLAEWRQAA